MLIGWYFCCSTSRQLFSCVKTFGSTSEKIIFQLTNNLEKKKVPYFRCELKHISSFPAGNPTKALALGLSTHHARAMVIMSPQGLRWSPYLIRNVISFWNTNDIESSKIIFCRDSINSNMKIYLPPQPTVLKRWEGHHRIKLRCPFGTNKLNEISRWNGCNIWMITWIWVVF